MRLGRRIPLLAVGSVLVTGLATAGISLWLSIGAIRTSALAATDAGADAYARTVSQYLDQSSRRLELLARLDPVASALGRPGEAVPAVDPAMRAELRRAAAGTFEYLALVRLDGTIAVVEPVDLELGMSRPDVAFLPWFSALVADGEVISDLHVSTITHAASVIVGTAARGADGLPIGYLVGGLSPTSLSALGGSPSGAYFGYLTDGRGLVVAHGRDPRIAQFQSDFSSVPAVHRALAGDSGVMEQYNPFEAEDRIAAFRPLPDLAWAVVYVIPSQTAFKPAEQLAGTIAAATAALMVATGLVAVGLARRATGPIARLSSAATAIAAGDERVILPAPTHDEVGELSAEFSRMLRTLGDREGELRRRAAELQAVNQELESFSYSVSHDLRAPLRSIVGFGQILLTEHTARLDDEARRVLGVVIRNAGQMSTLIDDLLAFSRASRKELGVREVDMRGMVLDVTGEIAATEPGRGIEFDVGDLEPSRGDPALLRQVWANLIDNAVKFSRGAQLPRVEVRSERHAEGRRYSVRDHGVGFDPAYTDKLFQPFQRLHPSTEFEGTGIGLAIVSRIVQRHGGTAWGRVEPGGGARFGFDLPIKEPA